jgi:microcystin-dependent protein
VAEPWIGQIIQFGGNYAIRNYAQCDGQLMPVSTNDALFALIGTIYGGDGRTTFGLPDLRGRVPMHQGHGPGLTPRTIGQRLGEENVTLGLDQMPSHQHGIDAGGAAANADPANRQPGNNTAANVYTTDVGGGTLNAGFVAPSGGSQGHNNMAPGLCINFQIALYGIFPSRH